MLSAQLCCDQYWIASSLVYTSLQFSTGLNVRFPPICSYQCLPFADVCGAAGWITVANWMLQKQSCRKSLQRPRVCIARAICGEEADQGGAGELMCRSGSGPVTMTSIRCSPGMAREVQARAVEAAQGPAHILSPRGWAGGGWHAAQAWQGPSAQGLNITKSPGAVGTGPGGSPSRGCSGSQGAGGSTRPPAGSFCEAVGVP